MRTREARPIGTVAAPLVSINTSDVNSKTSEAEMRLMSLGMDAIACEQKHSAP